MSLTRADITQCAIKLKIKLKLVSGEMLSKTFIGILTGILTGISIGLLSGLSGCDDTSQPSSSAESDADDSSSEPLIWVDLARGDAWSLAPVSEDPYSDQRGARERCTETDFGVEYGGLEVSTIYCDYITLTQPILVGLDEGDHIEVVLWHSPLVSEEPSTGAIALALGDVELGDVELWSTPLSIPSDAQSWTIELRAPLSVNAGAPLYFHVRNHGANAYTVLSARRGRRE